MKLTPPKNVIYFVSVVSWLVGVLSYFFFNKDVGFSVVVFGLVLLIFGNLFEKL